MLAVLIVIAAVTALGTIVVAAISRSRSFNEVDRFHRASAMTSEWARNGVTQPVIAEEEVADDEPVEGRRPRS